MDKNPHELLVEQKSMNPRVGGIAVVVVLVVVVVV